MDPDPFKHFDEQQRSYELVGEHREELLAKAREVLTAQPNIEVVALLLEAEAPEARDLRAAEEEAAGRSLAGQVLRYIVPRAMVIEMLKFNAPQALEWLPSSTMPTGGKGLPFAIFTKSGVRFAAAAYGPGG